MCAHDLIPFGGQTLFIRRSHRLVSHQNWRVANKWHDDVHALPNVLLQYLNLKRKKKRDNNEEKNVMLRKKKNEFNEL